MKNFLFILMLIFSASCVTQKKCALKYPSQNTRDSVYIETYSEVPIFLEGDSILVNVPVDCPDQDVALIENGKLKQVITILKGRLFSSTHIKPDTVYVPVKEITTVVKEVKIPQPEKYVPKFYKILLFANIGILVLLLAYLYLKIKNIRI